MSFTFRDVTIFCPYPDEIPWDLLGADPLEPETELMRVAKHGQRVVGVYQLARPEPLRFELLLLVVRPGYRGRFLGRWLLGHAIGVAESKGGRALDVPTRAARQFFEGAGFVSHDTGLRLEFTPE